MRKPTFPLRMDDGTEARSLEELIFLCRKYWIT